MARKSEKVSQPSVVESPEPEMFLSGPSMNKPGDAIPNTIYYEIDTGNRMRCTGPNQWTLIDSLDR